ncbi:MAG: hypothetical protein Q4D31_05010, partial [Eubacteriales bacterium]|nr:hypothetical protein [Eubacteriales bacterium]
LPNPVFTVQAIGGCSNATVLHAPRDSETYAAQDGSVSRSGRITSLTLELADHSGTYIFTSCTEFPTLLGVDWTVPLTLEVDLSGVDLGTATQEPVPSAPPTSTVTPRPAPEAVNLDELNAVIQTVEQVMNGAVVSTDGSEVAPSGTWTTQAERDALKTAFAKGRAALAAADQQTADNAAAALRTALASYQSAQKSGKKQAEPEQIGKTLAPGTYTVSANIWFNKADTGLPLNPHLTNSTFPPYDPVPDNATLTVNENGTAQVAIPIVIPDKVMTLRELRGASIAEAEKTADGAIISLTLDLDELSGDSTVVTDTWEADIEMGDLAMSISGLDKPHTWPAQFELDLSGVATTDGGVMPTVALTLTDDIAAAETMASVGANGDVAEDEPDDTPAATEVSETPEADRGGDPAAAVVLTVVFLAAVGAAIVVVKKKARGRR